MGSRGPTNSFLVTLTEAEQRALLSAGTQRRYRRNTWLFHQGDRSEFVVLLLQGHVKIVATTAAGDASILSVRGPYELVGELGVLDSALRLAGAMALEPISARVIAAEEFRALFADHPSMAFAVVRMLVRRLQEADRRRAEFGSADSTYRVARVLTDMAKTDELIALSQQEIAAMAGTSRESVARALMALRAQGLVATDRRRITVLDLPALQALIS